MANLVECFASVDKTRVYISLSVKVIFYNFLLYQDKGYTDLYIGQYLNINIDAQKEIIGEVTGFDRVKKSEACELVSSLTGDNSRQVVSFGTEAGLFQEIGISTVVCGPGSIDQAHKIDEFIVLDELKKCLNLLDGIKVESVSN